MYNNIRWIRESSINRSRIAPKLFDRNICEAILCKQYSSTRRFLLSALPWWWFMFNQKMRDTPTWLKAKFQAISWCLPASCMPFFFPGKKEKREYLERNTVNIGFRGKVSAHNCLGDNGNGMSRNLRVGLFIFLGRFLD